MFWARRSRWRRKTPRERLQCCGKRSRFRTRESLGGALLISGDASGAEKVFRDDLDRNPRNPRSLFGLQQALLLEKRDYDAGFVQKQFETSWKGGAQALKLDDLV